MTEKRYWLLKSEGDAYPIDALKKDKKTPWTGIRNFAARKYMRDQMQVGDLCLFYHSMSKEGGIYGLAKVASKPYPDPTQFEKKSEYFEPRATKEKPVWTLVDIAFVKKFAHPLSLAQMKADKELRELPFWKFNRLSVQPVGKREFLHIVEILS